MFAVRRVRVGGDVVRPSRAREDNVPRLLRDGAVAVAAAAARRLRLTAVCCVRVATRWRNGLRCVAIGAAARACLVLEASPRRRRAALRCAIQRSPPRRPCADNRTNEVCAAVQRRSNGYGGNGWQSGALSAQARMRVDEWAMPHERTPLRKVHRKPSSRRLVHHLCGCASSAVCNARHYKDTERRIHGCQLGTMRGAVRPERVRGIEFAAGPVAGCGCARIYWPRPRCSRQRGMLHVAQLGDRLPPVICSAYAPVAVA
jgi:hypothetical protein